MNSQFKLFLLLFIAHVFYYNAKCDGKPNKYVHIVYKAESYIIEKNYKRALHYYNKSFKINLKPASVDIYNAMLCANRALDSSV